MRLTPQLLKKLVLEEAAKFGKMKPVESAPKAEEVDADEYADTLEQHIDFMNALKIKEARLERSLRRLREKKTRLKETIARKL